MFCLCVWVREREREREREVEGAGEILRERKPAEKDGEEKGRRDGEIWMEMKRGRGGGRG